MAVPIFVNLVLKVFIEGAVTTDSVRLFHISPHDLKTRLHKHLNVSVFKEFMTMSASSCILRKGEKILYIDISILFMILHTSLTPALKLLYSKDGNPNSCNLSRYVIPDNDLTSCIALL